MHEAKKRVKRFEKVKRSYFQKQTKDYANDIPTSLTSNPREYMPKQRVHELSKENREY